jgi:flagellar hook-associated protein 3 FlgL
MRISTLQINQQGINSMLEISHQVATTQKQIASGKRIATPSDDPVGAARVIKINHELAIRGQYSRNIDAAEAQLAQEETVLQQVLDVMQRIRELSLQAANGVQTAQDRGYIATEIEARFDEIVSLVNTRGPTGEYLFSGFQGDVQPFVVDGEHVTFQGDEGQRRVQVDNGQFVAINDSGRALFMDVQAAAPVFNVHAHPDNDPLGDASISTGPITDRDALAAFFPDDLVVEFRPLAEDPSGRPNFTVRRRSDNRVVEGLQNVPYTPSADIQAQGMSFKVSGQPQPGDRFFVETSNKQDLLTTVRNIATGLIEKDPVVDPEGFEFLLGDTLTGLDNAMDSILEVQAQIGARFNSIDSTRSLHADLDLNAHEVLSEIRDLDFAEAVSRLSFQSFLLEAAQQSFVRVSGLSLFNAL